MRGERIVSVVGILAVLLGLVVVVFAIYTALTVRAPRVPNDLSERSDVDAWLENLVRSRAATAVSVAVVRDGDVLWESAAGDADSFAGREATTQTVYHVWSVTKVATALAVSDIVEKGLLDLDTEVQKILPWFEVEGDRDREMTVRDLLGHTSGLKDTVPAVFGWLRYDEALPNQTIFLREHLPDYRELRFRPGEERRYSNLGYMALGAVLEAVAGQKYAAVVRERVLGPAGMTASDFVFNRDLVAHEALGSHPIGSIFTPLLLFLVDMPDLIKERTGKLPSCRGLDGAATSVALTSTVRVGFHALPRSVRSSDTFVLPTSDRSCARDIIFRRRGDATIAPFGTRTAVSGSGSGSRIASG